jgi:hypothetical protein
VPGAEKVEMRMLRGARFAGSAVAGAAGTAARGIGWAGHKVGELATRRGRGAGAELTERTDELHGDHELPSGIGADTAIDDPR